MFALCKELRTISEIQSLARLKIHEGKIEEFKRVVSQDKRRIIGRELCGTPTLKLALAFTGLLSEVFGLISHDVHSVLTL